MFDSRDLPTRSGAADVDAPRILKKVVTTETAHPTKRLPDRGDSEAGEGSAREIDPFVSVVLPVRNEAAFIRENIENLLRQSYPAERYEIIVADGMSDDGTREILAALHEEHANVVVIDNPGKIVSTGLNAAIRAARGEIIIRLDGHAKADEDFIRASVDLLIEVPDAWSVGGPIRHAARTSRGRGIAAALGNPLGVGNARHRFDGYEGWVEGAQFPAFRKWIFDEIGGFDESLVRNQDDELNYRINKAGGRVYCSPRIRAEYFVRETHSQLFRQYVQYGFWRIAVIRKHGRPASLRQLAPLLLVTALAISPFAGLLTGSPWVALAIPLLYVCVLVAAGLAAIPKLGWRVAAIFSSAIAAMHIGYGLGMTYGAWAARNGRQGAEKRMSSLSR